MEIIQTIEQFAWIGWIALILIFFAIEALTLDMTFLMLGLGGGAGLVTDLVGGPLWLQVIVAALVAGLLILLLRPPLLQRLRRGEDPTPSNVDALVGLAGVVVATIGPASGQVRLANGETWSARSATALELPPGAPVSVARIDGATAVVTTIEEDFAS